LLTFVDLLFDLLIARFTQDIPLVVAGDIVPPFVIWNHEKIRELLSTIGAKLWEIEVGDSTDLFKVFVPQLDLVVCQITVVGQPKVLIRTIARSPNRLTTQRAFFVFALPLVGLPLQSPASYTGSALKGSTGRGGIFAQSEMP